MQAAYSERQADEFVILSVSEMENSSAVESFIARHGLDYPFMLDSDGGAGALYNLYTTPTTFFIGPEGVIRDILPGVVSKSWVERNLANIEQAS